MSITLPIRRLAPRTLFQHRHASTSPSNPILEAYQRQNPSSTSSEPTLAPRTGDLSPSSIFEDDRLSQATQTPTPSQTETPTNPRDPANTLRITDPDPSSRERWERKKIIQSIRKGGRLNREEFLARTEREYRGKSEELKTSVKKLGMLARQVVGKGVEEAIVQMRFSKKKVAGEVLRVLEAARDEAVVGRGMGLGNLGQEGDVVDVTGGQVSGVVGPSVTRPLEIQLKDGSRHRVEDGSKIYIDQAWVGRGKYGKLPDYRARGRVFIMHTPWTTISVVLKEEKTRVREWREREARRTKLRLGRVWQALPDRPVQGVRGQWYSW